MSETLSAIADLIWPLLALVLLAYVYVRRKEFGPPVTEFLRTRSVKAHFPGVGLEIGGQPVSAQQVVDDQRHQTEDLRQQLSLLSAQVAALQEAAPAHPDLPPETGPVIEEPLTRRVLWVDDEPTGNAYEIAALKDRGVKVEIATSTPDALRRLPGGSFDAVVTDMRRVEDGEVRNTAGLTLLSEVHEEKPDIPVVIYTSRRGVERNRSEAQRLGAAGITANPTELLELLAVNFGPRFSRRFKQQVEDELRAAGYEPKLERPDSPIDYRARHDAKTLGIDVKSSWRRRTATSRLKAKFEAIEGAGFDFPILIVTPEPVELPPDVRPPEAVELVPFDGLRNRLSGAT